MARLNVHSASSSLSQMKIGSLVVPERIASIVLENSPINNSDDENIGLEIYNEIANFTRIKIVNKILIAKIILKINKLSPVFWSCHEFSKTASVGKSIKKVDR